ncbi:globoside alpha-1,3-N-acetylgalactosaminyltransferase 1-like [Centroberyx affinis]|uniref:globoside alpha-1,3-N-acetylgalactosaminyltransferase 1-like n=1 Tax=Centroberyx affinis TaxID=166261 RepID=UPI003A5B9459
MMQLNFHRKPILLLFIVAVGVRFLWFLGCQLIRSSHFTNGGRFNQPSILVGRTDVVTVTPWLAPIVWEMTFDPLLMDSIYQPLNITIATTVFAVGKYTHFLRNFLVTAEQHFFVGLRVHYYVFTDRPDEVPSVNMTHGRQLTVLPLPRSHRWEQISTRRMELIQTIIETDLCNHADYIFCLEVDSMFLGRWGTETLERLVAVIHPGYYTAKRAAFPYERHPLSRAYVAPGQGDFYYSGGAFGGRLRDVHTLAKTCRENYEADAAQGVKAVRQEESYLNRYFLTNKPTKLLSPEYQWSHTETKPWVIRLFHFQNNYTDKYVTHGH